MAGNTMAQRLTGNRLTGDGRRAAGKSNPYFGQVIAKGTAEEIQNNDAVIEAYLGKQDKGEN